MTTSPPIRSVGIDRVGPRPLGLHLATAALSWTGAALPGGAWLSAIKGTDPVAESLVLVRSAEQQFDRLSAGIRAYHRHPYRRDVPETPVVWRSTGVRVLDFGVPDDVGAHPLLVIPSLINRHYILDLKTNHSLMRYLASAGFRPFLVAWDDFGRAAKFTTVDDCIAGKLEAVLGVVRLIARQKPVVIGYCLGGTLAAALAARRSADIAGLVSLAAPWDFHAGHGGVGPAAQFVSASLEPLLDTWGALPVDLVQTLFYTLDPFLVIDKFLRFAEADLSTSEAEAFVALEDWLNDGFPLPAPVARTLLKDWYGRNTPVAGEWTVQGKLVDLSAIEVPSLIVVPNNDRIVPPDSARAMAGQIPDASVLEVQTGHVGMMASRKAPEQVWAPLAAWLHDTIAR